MIKKITKALWGQIELTIIFLCLRSIRPTTRATLLSVVFPLYFNSIYFFCQGGKENGLIGKN